MITGQTPQRSAYARLAIENFRAQVYPLKHLIVINQSETTLIPHPNPQITENVVGKTDITLGALRNLALDMIPEGEYFTTWDDDDWRSPSYLFDFVNAMQTPKSIPALTSRYEYNLITGLTWIAFKPSGFVLFIAPNIKSIRYLNKQTMEDVEILASYKSKGYTIIPLNNAPRSYIRLVHGNNTSLYVDVNKNYMIENPDYYEKPTTDTEKTLVTKIMQPYTNVRIKS
jgi:hypothetical protein